MPSRVFCRFERRRRPRKCWRSSTTISMAADQTCFRMNDAAVTAEPSISWREYVDTRFDAQKEALTIKDSERQEALRLAREIQTYKDEKANELREQINRERILYATKDDLKAAVEKFEVAIG